MSAPTVADPIVIDVRPPASVVDMTPYVQAQEGVARLTNVECHALAWALAVRAAADHPQVADPAPAPARRRVGLLEVIRGVQCCNPAVTRYWQASRRWIALACIIVGVVLILETWQKAVLIGVACVVSLGARWTLGPKRCGP